MSADDIPAPPNPALFRPDAITIYGVQLSGTATPTPASIPFDGNIVVSISINERRDGQPDTPVAPKKGRIAVIYGYAFEGHCYRFDRPRIVILYGDSAPMPASGCGFGPEYTMWVIKSLDRVMELNIRNGLAEDLILESNLPGKRAPNTYGDHMKLAHRNGRLQRE
jgi:hypothetical protein